MSERRCKGCRWFWRYGSQQTGQCRRYPPTQNTEAGWLEVDHMEGCGEWADASITAEEAERRELVRQFALAIVQGMYANPEDTSVQVAKQAQLFAREFQETMQEGQQ